MSFADWHSGVTVAKTDNRYGFINTFTVDDLSYTPSEEEESRHASQVAATGRRSWKTLRGKGDAVWPPTLEAALIEALEKYQPEGLGLNKLLGRFPTRNRFISDYIFDATGKRRTPKQVGSRLQRMRDMCKGGPILDSISRLFSSAELEYMSESSETITSDESSQAPLENFSSSDLPTVVFVTISVQPSTSPVPTIYLISNDIANPLPICLTPLTVPTLRGHSVSRSSRGSMLCTLSNTVKFASPCALTPLSTFNVYLDGSHTPIHTEEVPLKCLSSPVESSGWLYGTELTPAFWRTLCEKKDPMRYTILQRLTTIQSCRPSNVAGPSSAPPELAPSSQEVSIVYHFDVVDELNIFDVVDDLNIFDTVDELNIRVPAFPSYFRSASRQQNEFVAPSQQRPTGLGYRQWDSGTYGRTRSAGYYYSNPMPAVYRYTQNEDPRYEARYGVPASGPWPNRHMSMPSTTSTHDQSELLFPFL